MKFSTSFASLVLAVGFVQGAFAVPRNTSALTPTPSGPRTTYAGIASDSIYCGSTTPCITASLINEKSAIQTYVGIPTIKPFFKVGGGVNYKYSLVGDTMRGFHIGMGIGLGAMEQTAATRTFFINIQPLLGVHFHIVERILLNFDTGLTFQIQTEGASNLDLILGGNSILMGMSIQYAL